MKKLSEIITLIKKRRKALGLDQREMLLLIGMKQQQYQRIEAGQDIKVSTLLRILEGLKLSLEITENDKKITIPLEKTERGDNPFWDNELQHLKDE
jgi:transcriptional regulator with XRE-family HTH domain